MSVQPLRREAPLPFSFLGSLSCFLIILVSIVEGMKGLFVSFRNPLRQSGNISLTLEAKRPVALGTYNQAFPPQYSTCRPPLGAPGAPAGMGEGSHSHAGHVSPVSLAQAAFLSVFVWCELREKLARGKESHKYPALPWQQGWCQQSH